MSEEIIIGGVDVSGCDRLRTFRDWTYSSDKWCGISNDGGCECEQNVNCLYKQLKRLQAENERLNSTCLQFQSSELKQHLEKVNCERENEELKKRDKENLHYLACMTSQRNKLKLALEEIRDMCSNTCEKNKDCIHSCYECKSIDEPVAINRILNKINEVLK